MHLLKQFLADSNNVKMSQEKLWIIVNLPSIHHTNNVYQMDPYALIIIIVNSTSQKLHVLQEVKMDNALLLQKLLNLTMELVNYLHNVQMQIMIKMLVNLNPNIVNGSPQN